MKKAAEWIIPDWLDADAWADYEAHRQEIKQPLTDRARALATNKLRGLSKQSQRKTIDRTIESGWTGLFPEQPNQGNGQIAGRNVCVARKMDEKEWRQRQKVALDKIREIKKEIAKM